MKNIGLIGNLVQNTKIFRRYFLNVRKIPIKSPVFVSYLTEVRKDGFNMYSDEFDIQSKEYGLSEEYHKTLYIMTRILKPETVIETGVFEGHSSVAILMAMEKNETGLLYSIDLPPPSLPPGKEPGWIVPEHLREKWDLKLGKSTYLLQDLLSEVKEVDIFLHDSDHSYENMSWEFRTAWPYIRKDGLLLSHDVSQNAAFREFAKNASEKYYYMLKNCGGIKRTK